LPASASKPRGLSTLRPYLSLLRGQESQLLLATLLMTVSTTISLVIPLTAGRFVDDLSSVADLPGMLNTRHLTVLVVLLILQLCGTFLFTVVSARLGLRTVTRLRRRLFAHLLELPSLYFVDHKAGDLSSRLTGDRYEITELKMHYQWNRHWS